MARRIDKQRLVFALVAAACLFAPLPFLYDMLPKDAPPQQGPFSRLPVAEQGISNIQVGHFQSWHMPVQSTQSRYRMPVGDADLGRMPVQQVWSGSHPDADAIPVQPGHLDRDP